jgi:SAM-dependent methyltransferase
VLGKRVIYPGGRRSTQQLLEFASLAAGQQVLDIGCGVATTTIQVAQRFNARVTAADLAPLMLARANRDADIAARLYLSVRTVEVTCPRCSPNSAPGIKPTSPPATWNGSDVKDGDAETVCHQPEASTREAPLGTSAGPWPSQHDIGWMEGVSAPRFPRSRGRL